MTVVDRIPPHDEGAELAVIGCVLLDAQAGTEIPDVRAAIDALAPEDFYAPQLGRIWDEIRTARATGRAPDPVTIRAAVDDAALERLGECLNAVRTPVYALQFARSVIDHAKRRHVIRACYEASQAAYEGDERAVELLRAAIDHTEQGGEQVDGHLPDLMDGALAELRRTFDMRTGGDGCLPWRIRELDMAGSFLRPGDFAVVAGRPGLGKSTFALWWALQTAKASGRPVLFASLEMTPAQLAVKALCAEAGVFDPGHRAPTADVDAKLTDAAAFIREVNLDVIMPERMPRKTSAWCSWVRAAVYREKPCAVVVDYLGCLRGDGRTVYEKVTDTSQRVRAVALDTGVPFVVLHQMNRSIESENRLPKKSDLRDSGQIEQDATHILFLHKASGPVQEVPELGIQRGDLLLVLRKSRFGKGNAIVRMHAEYGKSRIMPQESPSAGRS